MVEYGITVPMTAKQLQALKVIANEAQDGEPLDLDTVIARLPYKTTKQSFQFVVRSLIRRELIEKLDRTKLRKKSRRMLQITPLGLCRLNSEFRRAEEAADPKTCLTDEIEKTDRLLAQIEEDLKNLDL